MRLLAGRMLCAAVVSLACGVGAACDDSGRPDAGGTGGHGGTSGAPDCSAGPDGIWDVTYGKQPLDCGAGGSSCPRPCVPSPNAVVVRTGTDGGVEADDVSLEPTLSGPTSTRSFALGDPSTAV